MVATLVSSRSVTNGHKLESITRAALATDDEMRATIMRDIVEIVRLRARAAGEHMAAASMDARASLSWPATVLASEQRLRKQISTIAPSIFPLRLLQQRFALSETEQRILWILIAEQLCPIARQLLRGIATEPTLDPTTDILRRVVFGEDGRLATAELGPNGLLRRYGFIERVNAIENVPEHRFSWTIARRVLALAYGDLSFDETLGNLASVRDGRDRSFEGLHLSKGVEREIGIALERRVPAALVGPIGYGKRSAICAATARLGMRVLQINAQAVATTRVEAEQQLRGLARECRLLDLVPVFSNADALLGAGNVPDRFDVIEKEFTQGYFATSTNPLARPWQNAPRIITVSEIDRGQRCELWSRVVPTASTNDVELLTSLYPLSPSLITAVGRASRGSDVDAPAQLVEAGVRSVLDGRLAGLATRMSVSQSWTDIVLPDQPGSAVIEILSRVRDRARVYDDWGFRTKLSKGLGITALFSGPPGTGKSMAAGLIGRELRSEVYQVDLSKIASKWIGETEKNLATLFDVAEAGNAILLFDEADAVFGKRTGVKSSNDRYANQETNYLLQRFESYSGICILTTNHEHAMDDAFRRRLSVHARFPMPEVDERAAIWAALLPKTAPIEGELRLGELAKTFVMSGGYIRNAVLRAAFLAANDRGAIDASRLWQAAQIEYEAIGRVAMTPRQLGTKGNDNE